MAQDFWRHSGFHLLGRDAGGRLLVTDDFLRAYYLRPELRPVAESCANETALHEALMDEPRMQVQAGRIEALADADARSNYRIVLDFRARLLAAPTLEACYLGLFAGGDVVVPPLFIDQLAQIILRNILGGVDDALELRAAELFYREQKASLQDGAIMLADLETIALRASGGAGDASSGGLAQLIAEAQAAVRRPPQWPAMVIRSISMEPHSREPRASTSRPTAVMERNMSRRLPAMVISSTGWRISPPSTQ